MSGLFAPALDAPPLGRHGYPVTEYPASPAAGADYSDGFGGGYLCRLIAVHARLVTSADVADRELVLEYRDGQDQRIDLMGAPVEQTASTTTDYVFSAFQGQAEWPVDGSVLVPLHPLLLPLGFDARLHIVGVQATDALSRIRVTLERFDVGSPPG